MSRAWISGSGVAAALCAGAIAVAQDAVDARSRSTLSVGMTLTDGNSETLQANASLVTEAEKERLGSLRAGVEANYGESTVASNTETTVENARLFANVRKTLSPRTFGCLDGSALYDDVAQIDYRAMLGPGLGAYLVKSEKSALSVEAGPSYVWEKVAGVSDDYLALRFGERFAYAMSESARVWQSAEYSPTPDDFSDYLLTAELGAEAALNAKLNLRLVLQDRYDSTPGPGLEKNDLSLIAGVSLSL